MDDGELIERVEQFELLYNKKNVDFKNKVKRENAWQTISSILGGGVTPQECDQRWTVLRNKYVTIKRSLKNMPSGSQAYTVSWPYINSMKFLDPYIQARKTVSNFSQLQQHSEFRNVRTNVEDDETLTSEVENSNSFDAYVEEYSETDTSNTETPTYVPPFKKLKEKENENQEENIMNSNLAEIKKIRAANTRHKTKPQEVVVNKLEGCLDTFGKLMEARQSSSQVMDKGDEDFARSLTRDLAVFTAIEKITVKRKIYDCMESVLKSRQNDT